MYTTGTEPGAEAGPGRLVGGRYELLTKLGEGGFGEVWRAKDRSLDIDVAVKQVRLPLNAPQSQRAAQTERALREARHAAKLRDHPNVVAVHDVVDDGGPWIVMQLVEGRTLADRVKDDDPVSEAEAVYLAISLLQALRAAQANEATYASDLFSLGATLYHAVEGESPFHRDTPTGSLTAVLLDDPKEPQRAGVLKPLLGALLQKDPA